MRRIWSVLYTLFFVIPFEAVIRIMALFSEKVRKTVAGRKKLFEGLILAFNKLDKSKKLVWIHSASMGEFEQAKPIIELLRKTIDINLLVTFFSPSGYENSKKYPHADVVSYLPFDTRFNARRFAQIVRPDIAVFMRYDIWPNLIWSLSKKKVPLFIVDATMRDASPRMRPLARQFHKSIYSHCTKILTVSSNDAKNFSVFDIHPPQVEAAGDTRFDRVYERSLIARQKNLLPEDWYCGKKVLVAGSIWQEDEEVLVPAVKKLLQYHKDLICILVPHEPNLMHLEKLESEFQGKEKTIRFSYAANNYAGERVILVDSIGILLTLYCYATAAFVGGSFKSSIHNVLEAAVYGIPVVFGPKIQSSIEARAMVENGSGLLVRNRQEMYRTLSRVLFQEAEQQRIGTIAKEYVMQNKGATARITQEIISVL